jgi:hypothetical protein
MLGHLSTRVNALTVIIAGRILVAYLVAVLVAYLLGAMAATQSVLASIEGMGVVVTLAERVSTTGKDLIGMFPSYGLIIALALAIALPVATTISRYLPRWRAFGLVSAGVVAIVVPHLLMRELFEITPVAAARTTVGLLVQGLAGGVGGYAFYFMRDP